VHLACACLFGGLDDGAPFHIGCAGGHAHQHAGGKQSSLAQNLVDHIAQHLQRDGVVGNHAIHEGFDRRDVAGGASEHQARLFADRQHLARRLRDGDHRRLAQYNPAPPLIDQQVRRAQIHAQFRMQPKHTHGVC
jgi:hypothetical protein